MANKKTDPADIATALAEATKSGFSSLERNGVDYTIVLAGLSGPNRKAVFQGAEDFMSARKDRAAYSDRTAWVMAELSNLAYLKFEDPNTQAKEELLAELADAGFKKTELLNCKDGTQGFVTVRPGEYAVLAFRGTETNKADILKDLNARFLETPSGRAHRGFTSAYEDNEKPIRAALDKLLIDGDGNQIPLFVTGHSLGGAIATVATQELEESYSVAACYTYGSPRVGTSEWSQSVKSPLYRIVNGADGVPLVPMSAVSRTVALWVFSIPPLTAAKPYVEKVLLKGFFGFQHAGDMRFIIDSDRDRLRIGSAAALARIYHVTIGTLSRGLFAITTKLGMERLSGFFADHSIGRYAGILRKIADERNP